MRRTSEETKDDSWIDGFKVAYELHLNFYNDNMAVPVFETNRLIVRNLVRSLLEPGHTAAGNSAR